MNNKFTGVTPDKKMKTIEIDRYINQQDGPYVARVFGQLTYKEVFERLKSHLEYVEMLPDQYFNLSLDINPDEHIPKDWRSFNFNTAFGAPNGIGIEISLNTGHGKIDFISGKMEKDGIDDFLQMNRIAAECDLMLNGNGKIFDLPKDVRNMLKERSVIHGNLCHYNFYVISCDTQNYYRDAEPTSFDLTLDEAKTEFINRLNRHDDTITTKLGIEFHTDHPDIYHHTVGAMDLISYQDGKMKLVEDWEKDPVLNAENTFPDLIKELKRYFAEGLTDSESKLVRSGLVNGESKDVHEKSAMIKGGIEHHNELEDEGGAEDDQWDL